MIIRLLFLVVTALLLLILIKKITNFVIRKTNSESITNSVQRKSVLVKCSHCGARIPKENAENKGAQIFHCKDHSDERD